MKRGEHRRERGPNMRNQPSRHRHTANTKREITRIQCAFMPCRKYWKNLFPTGKIHMNALSSQNNNPESWRRFWQTSCQVDSETRQRKGKHRVDGEKLLQSHILCNHCVVSFALPRHTNTLSDKMQLGTLKHTEV